MPVLLPGRRALPMGRHGCRGTVLRLSLIALPLLLAGAETPGLPSLLARRLVLAATRAVGSGPGRRLDNGPVVSELRHNGTALERVVEAKWECAFPQGECFKNQAPLEGLPTKIEDCTKEENQGPLTINMVIDLHCAGLHQQMLCDGSKNTASFDPFYTCNSDPLLIKATCQIDCASGRPMEVCTFNFDSSGIYNMSDKTVEVCSLEATCKSPYIEQNHMFCSGRQSTEDFSPHWMKEDDPWRHRENHGLEAPRLTATSVAASPAQSFMSQALWLAAYVFLGVGLLTGASRLGLLPDFRRCFGSGDVRQYGGSRASAPYRPPPAGAKSMQYVAPAAPSVGGPRIAASAAEDEDDDEELVPADR